MKIIKYAELLGKKLDLETALEEVEVSERKKKLGTEGCIWSESFPAMAGKQGRWIQDGKFLRVGVSAVVLQEFDFPENSVNHKKVGVIMSRFDSGHPTAGGKISPPAGVWDGDKSLLESALSELGQEVILTYKGGHGFWSYGSNNTILELSWVRSYAKDHNLESRALLVPIYPLENDDIYQIILDGKFQGSALLAFEPENGGIEIMFLFRSEFRDGEFPVHLIDGEKAGDRWLHREVGFFVADNLANEKKTSKAEVIENFLKTLYKL